MKIQALRKLIQLTERKLDEKRIELMKETAALSTLEKQLVNLKQKILFESKLVQTSSELFYSSTEFFESMRLQCIATEEKIRLAEHIVDKIKEELMEIVSEKKKYEHVLSNHLNQLKKKEWRKENLILDEFAMTQSNINNDREA